jgi:hypothetical protein
MTFIIYLFISHTGKSLGWYIQRVALSHAATIKDLMSAGINLKFHVIFTHKFNAEWPR